METIILPCGTWLYDPAKPLGEAGGFGAVFLGAAHDGSEVAVKRLNLTADDAAHRELRIADELAGHKLPNVMPILDSGLDSRSGRYFIVMPRAEYSLHAFIQSEGPPPEGKVISILYSIASGLETLSTLVHRDLKPANVLWHQGAWKIADFGIARFIAEATSERTLKDAMSIHYAAPEQWKMDRSTKATDVYALGCMAYTLLTGAPPFSGSTWNELMLQHTQKDPPALSVTPALRQVVANCLRKNPQARPPLASLCAQLKQAAAKLVQPPDPLSAAAAQIAHAAAIEDAARARTAAGQRARRELARDGSGALIELMNDLSAAICEAAINAQWDGSEIRLGNGKLRYQSVFSELEVSEFAATSWGDVVLGFMLEVGQKNARYPGRSANLWYGDLDKSGHYRWWEAAYWSWGRSLSRSEPTALVGRDGLRYAKEVVSNITCGVQFAYKPRPIDGEFRDAFVKRWKDWFAAASLNQLQSPSRLPEEKV